MRAVALVASVVSSLALPVSVPIGDNLPDASRFAYADEAKKGELTFSDINILQLTDVHSWLSGHKHEIGVEATYADCLSFFEHLKANAAKFGKDLFLFNSGDIVDGTGLPDATKMDGEALTPLIHRNSGALLKPKPETLDALARLSDATEIDGEALTPLALTPLIQQMRFTALTSGNHELYRDETMTHMVSSGFVDSWKGRYITGNVHNATTGELIGAPYAIVKGDQKSKILVFGFLFNMLNNCKASDQKSKILFFGFLFNMLNHCKAGDQQSKILVFGVLFNMLNHCKAVKVSKVEEAVREGAVVKVSKVEEAVKESWFQEALSLQKSLYSLQKVKVSKVEEAVTEPWFSEALDAASGVDAIVVLVHMDVADVLIDTILRAIRAKGITVLAPNVVHYVYVVQSVVSE
ncbi:Metallo-dependent phosphatase-like protein [Baffinella frigidus]|nr:Metallo-dependent phosphatase-like protein [Cryptophyta sp. CCMP2293]